MRQEKLKVKRQRSKVWSPLRGGIEKIQKTKGFLGLSLGMTGGGQEGKMYASLDPSQVQDDKGVGGSRRQLRNQAGGQAPLRSYFTQGASRDTARQGSAGQAALIMVLVVGLVSILGSVALSSVLVGGVKVESDVQKGDAAWYAAWSGVDEIMYRLRSRQEFPSPGIYQLGLTLDSGATVSAEIEGDDNQKTVRATGYADGAVRRIEVSMASSSGKASFVFAAQSGLGGFEIEGNAEIVGTEGGDGNVYSNGDILGESKSSGNSGSRIQGTVWAVGEIGALGGKQGAGVYITGDAWAGELTACNVEGDAISPLPPVNCSYGGDFILQDAPETVSLSAIDVGYWKAQAELGETWVGDCNVGATNGSDCTQGTSDLGPMKIDGDLNISSNESVVLKGAVWVDGDMSVAQNNTITVGEEFGNEAAVVVVSDSVDNFAKGRVLTSSNVDFVRNSLNAGLIVISENKGVDCAVNPAIDITSNTNTVVFVAVDGCIMVGSNSILAGVLGNKVHVSNNSTIEYDPSLAQAILGTELGGWKVVGFREY